MSLRLIDTYLPDETASLDDLREDTDVLGCWHIRTESAYLIRLLVRMEDTESFLDQLQAQLDGSPEARIIVQPVEAVLPRPESVEDEDEAPRKFGRVSREELVQRMGDSTSMDPVYFALVVLSTLVAAGGLLKDSVAVVIGAMVIAPLIGPNLALALATTLGDLPLLGRALAVNAAGIVLAFGLSVLVGFLVPFDAEIAQLATRTEITLADVLLALAAGAAGALSITRGAPTALIGVMVAVALLPPLAACGMFFGGGYGHEAFRALLLVMTNVIAINLAGVATFLAQGIRPSQWYEAQRARRATYIALALWGVLLGALVALAFFVGDFPLF